MKSIERNICSKTTITLADYPNILKNQNAHFSKIWIQCVCKLSTRTVNLQKCNMLYLCT